MAKKKAFSSTRHFASFGRRFAAVIIDAAIFWAIGEIIHQESGGFFWTTVLGFVYAVWMLGMYGATVGKRVVGIRVVKENGKKLTYSDAAVRELSKYLSAFPFLLGYLWMLWDNRKQTWHDKIAGTLVVH
jgi:uncharacterized RDD family membrane protein YckC